MHISQLLEQGEQVKNLNNEREFFFFSLPCIYKKAKGNTRGLRGDLPYEHREK